MKKTVLLLLMLPTMLVLAGCAAMQRPASDGETPAKVCPSTSIGGENKTFCY